MSDTLAPRGSALDVTRRAAFRPVLLLVWAFAAVSAGMIVFLVIASAAGVHFDAAVWVRTSIVLASSVVLLVFAVRAARGSRAAWVRLRIIAPVICAAVVVIVSIPGFLPTGVRVEQAICGILLLPVAILVNLPRARALFAAKA